MRDIEEKVISKIRQGNACMERYIPAAKKRAF